MSTIRHFSGSREQGKKSIAKEILQLEMQKKGKLPAQMRYKLIFRRKQEEAKAKAASEYASKHDAGKNGKLVGNRNMSSKAEQALKEMAMKKAAKEQKKLRKMVIVAPQNFSNGSINKKGQIFDIAGNMVGKVNTKNGSMSTMNGWGIGKYKPKSYMTKLMIEQAIDKHSPYFLKLRQMAAQQAALVGVHGAHTDPNVVNVHGMSAQAAMLGGGMYGNLGQHGDHGVHGMDPNAPTHLGSNVGATAWGAMSNNAWGTFSGNVHGTMADNVHGTMNADVWGSVGGSDLWGRKGVRMYGTGSGANYLSGVTKFILGLFGYQSKAAREALRQQRALRSAGVSVSSSGQLRQSAPRPSSGGPRR